MKKEKDDSPAFCILDIPFLFPSPRQKALQCSPTHVYLVAQICNSLQVNKVNEQNHLVYTGKALNLVSSIPTT